jgi:glycosyltransferase involved in cell wall biosynthesis
MNSFSAKRKARPSIIFVIDSLEAGGAESQLAMLAAALGEAGYPCKVFALRAEGPFRVALQRRGVAVVDGGVSARRNWPTLLRGITRLWTFIRASRPCLVHGYLPMSNLLGSVIGRLAGATAVVTSRRWLPTHQGATPQWRLLDRVSNALSDVITVNSAAVGDDIARRDGVARAKLACIYNGLDFSRFDLPPDTRDRMRSNLRLAPTDFAWIKVANLAELKGHVDLLAAFAEIPRAQRARLFLAGADYGEQVRLQALATDLGIADRVTFLGGRSDVPEILSAMDGYVGASHTEGFSNAILEAMAAGLPIVTTNVGGNAEALQHGKLGMLVEPHDPAGLGNAMLAIMDDAGMRKVYAAAAKETARATYGIGRMVDAHVRLYDRLAGGLE